MAYYLLEHENPNGPFYYTSRRRPLVGIVVHCTAGLEDLDGEPDHSAERTAAYAASTARAVSWHSGSDTDSSLELLPPSYTAFQVRGYNSSTYGHEISKRTMVWEGMPEWWVADSLGHAADHLGSIVRDAGIPVRKITRSQLDAAIAAGDPSMGGFIGHRELDPDRRSDPGADFPWGRFLALVEGDDMVDRKTSVDPNPVLEDDFDQMRESKVYTSHTDPGGVVFKDELAAFLNRYHAYVVKPEIAEQNKTAWAKAEDWVRDHVKSSIAAALAAGAGSAQIDYGELVEQIGRALSGG